MLGAVRRFAGNKHVLNFLKPALANGEGNITKWSVARRVAPDVAFAALGAAQTPGDIGDKAITFATQAGGGIIGGAGASTLTRGKFGGTEEWIGGFAGDFAGQQLNQDLQRAKDSAMGGEGLSGWERMSKEQQDQFAAQLEQQILSQYGLLQGNQSQFLMV